MRLRGAFLVCIIMAGPSSAYAADDFIKGIYLQSEELCVQAKKDGIETVAEAGNMVLSASGLESVEYNCEFVQVTKAQRSPAWAVTAICQEPGHLSPDLLSVTQMSPTQIELVSLTPASAEGEVGGNGGSYVLCDGLSTP